MDANDELLANSAGVYFALSKMQADMIASDKAAVGGAPASDAPAVAASVVGVAVASSVAAVEPVEPVFAARSAGAVTVTVPRLCRS